MLLATVLDQNRGRDATVLTEAVELGGQSAGPHRLGLADIAQAPQPAPGRLGRGQDDLRVSGRRLRCLIQDEHRAGVEGTLRDLQRQPGDRDGRDPDVS
jgi:hypothetical protein